MKPTLAEALTALFGEGTGTTPTTIPSGTTTTTVAGSGTSAPSDLAALVAQANQLYLAALAAQRSGDWAGYGRLIEQLGGVLQKLTTPQ
jgi:uncharacterized membrane protein (UPF0182 family)